MTKKEARAELVQRLRSGQYEQGIGALRDTKDKFCCLGVACQVYQDLTGKGEWTGGEICKRDVYKFVVDDSEGITGMPGRVAAYFGFTALNGGYQRVPLGNDKVVPVYTQWLAHDNDHGQSFSQIADTIESEPEGLFD
jgi:hypothetical protein